jgi:acyl-CoA synthetase (NDP forming)
LTNNIRKLLAPESIAIVGASDRPGPGIEITSNALRSATGGRRVHLINPNRDTLFDAPCYKSLRDLPEVPDCVVFATSAKVMFPVLREAAELGVGAAIVLGSGFAESSLPEGAADQRQLAEIAAGAGMAVCGPNCLGLADLEHGLFASSMAYQELDPGIHPRSIAIVSQSGGLLIGMINRAASRRLPIRLFVSSGNEAVTGAEDYLEALVDDPGLKVIAVIVEGLADLDRITAAGKRAAANGKRVALLKLGRSALGRRAVSAHTGRDPGDDEAMMAALSEAGIAYFDRPDELIEFCQLTSRFPRPPGSRASAIMVSGGASALISDIGARRGVPFAKWSGATVEGLRALLPDYATVYNPLDLTGGTMLFNREAVERAIRLIDDDPQTDFLVFVFPMQPSGGSEGLRGLMTFITDLGPTLAKPLVVVSTNCGTVTNYWADFSANSPSPLLEDGDTAFTAFAAWSQALGRPS